MNTLESLGDIMDAQILTDDQMLTLSALADAIIPPDAALNVPGAGDMAICRGIATDAKRQRQLAQVEAALSALDALSDNQHDAGLVGLTGFGGLDDVARAPVIEAFRAAHSASADMIANLAVQSYYRDARVMLSLGMEARPPHPQGYEVEQGDWSLLDAVRQRPKMFREA